MVVVISLLIFISDVDVDSFNLSMLVMFRIPFGVAKIEWSCHIHIGRKSNGSVVGYKEDGRFDLYSPDESNNHG